MSTMDEQVEELRTLLLNELTSKIKSGKARSQDLATTVKFLKDYAEVQRALNRPTDHPSPEELDELLEGEELPFGNEEDPEGRDNSLEGVDMEF